MRFARLHWAAGAVFLALRASAAVVYVDVSGTNPVPPYAGWGTAATNIQDAVDAASAGDQILVSDGVYQSGGRVVFGAMTNRVAVTKPVAVQSVNGPAATVIQGYQVPGTTNGDAAVRCVYLTNGASLSGFTLSGGATRAAGDQLKEQSGGGIWCAGNSNSLVVNCVFTGNAASRYGGGAEQGVLNNCKLSANSALYGSGCDGGTLNNCVLIGHPSSAAQNCLCRNCTIVSNTIGAQDGSLWNCIVYYNTFLNLSGARATNCCVPGGQGSVTNAPLFVNAGGGDFHLQPGSPCINSGINGYTTNSTDLDGNPRIAGGTVDLGAYEFQTPASIISYAWLQHYGLPTDGSGDFADSDGDGMNNWKEWVCGTDPTNALSVLRVSPLRVITPGLQVSWQSVSNRVYYVQRGTNLTGEPAFTSVRSNITSQTGTASYVDTPTGPGPFFYRVGVQ